MVQLTKKISFVNIPPSIFVLSVLQTMLIFSSQRSNTNEYKMKLLQYLKYHSHTESLYNAGLVFVFPAPGKCFSDLSQWYVFRMGFLHYNFAFATPFVFTLRRRWCHWKWIIWQQLYQESKLQPHFFPLTYVLLALIPILSYVNRVTGWQREGSTVVQPLTYHLVTIQRQGWPIDLVTIGQAGRVIALDPCFCQINVRLVNLTLDNFFN